MLEHVALGQARFMTPGVAPDPRGVILGRYALLVFPTLEGVVSWLRLYSAEASLDELLTGLSIHRVVTPLMSRGMVVQIPASSSYTIDRAARCARLIGGTTYTGTSKHYVKYRDDRSPYGYDLVEVSALPQGADYMLHGLDFTQTYAREGELSFAQLLFRLSLRRVPGGARLGSDEKSEVLLTVQRGLGEGVIRYLWRNRVAAEVGLLEPKAKSSLGELGRDPSYLVMRVRNIPERILALFLATPGIDVFRPAGPGVAVELGFAHVIDLSSCASVFSDDSFFLFWGQQDRVDQLPGPLELANIENLTGIEIELEEPKTRNSLDLSAHDSVGVGVRLAPSLQSPRNVIASLVPLAQADLVKRLIYFLPPTSLRGHRVAVTDRGILLMGSDDLDVVPLGQLLSELAPGLLVPLGMDLVPRVAPEVLGRTLGHGAGVLTVFPHDEVPFQISDAALQPLERRALAKIEVARATARDTSVAEADAPMVVNDPIGRFSLWGFPSLPTTKALPPKGG